MGLGLKVVRVGKASAVSESLWDYTLDAAIHRDRDAQKALENAAQATAQLNKIKRRRGKASSSLSDQSIRDAATAAVKASIEVSCFLYIVFLRVLFLDVAHVTIKLIIVVSTRTPGLQHRRNEDHAGG